MSSLSLLAAELLSEVKPLPVSPALAAATVQRDIFAESQQKAWRRGLDPRCDFDSRPRLSRHAGVWVLSLWQSSPMGRTLQDIKSDPAEVCHFAEAVSDFVVSALGGSLPLGGWAVVTTPKRRHRERNFASMVAAAVAVRLALPFYEDCIVCRNLARVNPDFSAANIPHEPNVLLFDDIVTTGSTLKATHAILTAHGKNIITVVGINNNR